VKLGLIVDLEFLQDTDIWQFSAPFFRRITKYCTALQRAFKLKVCFLPWSFQCFLNYKSTQNQTKRSRMAKSHISVPFFYESRRETWVSTAYFTINLGELDFSPFSFH